MLSRIFFSGEMLDAPFKKLLLTIFAAFALLLSGCLGDDNAAMNSAVDAECVEGDVDCEEDHEDEDPSAEACEHYESGPFVSVAAVSEATSTEIGAVANDHMAYQVALTEITATGENGGYVQFNVAEATDYLFFFSEDVHAHFFESDGSTEIEPESEVEGSEDCPLVAVTYLIELPVGTVLVELEGHDIEQVDLVIEEAAGHDDHEGEEDGDDDHDHDHE